MMQAGRDYVTRIMSVYEKKRARLREMRDRQMTEHVKPSEETAKNSDLPPPRT